MRDAQLLASEAVISEPSGLIEIRGAADTISIGVARRRDRAIASDCAKAVLADPPLRKFARRCMIAPCQLRVIRAKRTTSRGTFGSRLCCSLNSQNSSATLASSGIVGPLGFAGHRTACALA